MDSDGDIMMYKDIEKLPKTLQEDFIPTSRVARKEKKIETTTKGNVGGYIKGGGLLVTGS